MEKLTCGSATPCRPRHATRKELCQYHDEDYVDYVLNQKNSTETSADASIFGIEDVHVICMLKLYRGAESCV